MSRLTVLFLALAFIGCEDDVNTTVGEDLPFSLYGYLDPTADRQAIRVVPITDRIDDDMEGALEAVVTSTDLGTGVSSTWRDSTVTFADGTTGTVFVADLTPAPGSRVRLEATDPTGAVSAVEVTIPPIVAPELGVARFGLGEVIYPIRFDGVPRVLSGQLRLVVGNLPSLPAGETAILRIPIEARPREVSPGVWTAEVPFVTSVRRVLNEQGIADSGVRLLSAQYVGFVSNAEWDPPTTDVDALAEPGTFSNVEGGLGFVGAGYFSVAQWIPSPTTQISAGFAVDREAVSYIALNEVVIGDTPQLEFYNPLLTPIVLNGYSISDDFQEPRKQTFVDVNFTVPARGYLVVPIQFAVEPGVTILGLYNRSGSQLSRLFVDTVQGGESYGSFPDGLSFRLPQGGPDIFQGGLRPTLGGPNEINIRPAFINEILTEGTSGYVEGVTVDGFDVSGMRAMSDPVEFFDAPRLTGTGFPVARETPGVLDLLQTGGTVYLVATYFDPTLGPEGSQNVRVVDARVYGGQSSGRSSGYVPDAPAGTWTPGITPTPGASNGSGRRSL